VFRVRIIPATISVALLLFCVKTIELFHSTEALAQTTPPQTPSTTATTPAAPAPAAVPAAASPPAAATPTTPAAAPKAAPAAKDAPKEVPKAPSTKPEATEGKEDKGKNPAVSDAVSDTVDRRYTPIEVELLQHLVKRREELDRWQKNIEIKEATLDAAEKRVNDKITQIENMKKEVTELLAQYNEKEDAKINSLVKIYENMKPKDAARIFDEVEMPILLLVIDKMPEKKTAPILALMDPKKAKQLTVQIAEQHRIGGSALAKAASPNLGTPSTPSNPSASTPPAASNPSAAPTK